VTSSIEGYFKYKVFWNPRARSAVRCACDEIAFYNLCLPNIEDQVGFVRPRVFASATLSSQGSTAPKVTHKQGEGYEGHPKAQHDAPPAGHQSRPSSRSGYRPTPIFSPLMEDHSSHPSYHPRDRTCHSSTMVHHRWETLPPLEWQVKHKQGWVLYKHFHANYSRGCPACHSWEAQPLLLQQVLPPQAQP